MISGSALTSVGLCLRATPPLNGSRELVEIEQEVAKGAEKKIMNGPLLCSLCCLLFQSTVPAGHV